MSVFICTLKPLRCYFGLKAISSAVIRTISRSFPEGSMVPLRMPASVSPRTMPTGEAFLLENSI